MIRDMESTGMFGDIDVIFSHNLTDTGLVNADVHPCRAAGFARTLDADPMHGGEIIAGCRASAGDIPRMLRGGLSFKGHMSAQYGGKRAVYYPLLPEREDQVLQRLTGFPGPSSTSVHRHLQFTQQF